MDTYKKKLYVANDVRSELITQRTGPLPRSNRVNHRVMDHFYNDGTGESIE